MYLRAAGLLQLLDPALDLADRVEVVGQGRPVARAQSIAHAACLRHHVIEDAAGLLRNLGALGVRIALAEQLIEHLSRVVLHRQWLCWRTERDGAGKPTADARRACDAARTFPREFDRREWGALSDGAGRKLVRGDSQVSFAIALFRPYAGEPGARNDAVGIGALAAFVAEAGDHSCIGLVGLQGREDLWKVEARAHGGRFPAVHDRAVWKIDKPQSRLRRRRGGGQCGRRGDHRIEQR